MKQINFLLIVILTGYSFVNGQEEQPKTVKSNRIRDIYIQTGLFSESNTNGTLADFKRLSPQSVLLSNDLTEYSPDGGFSYTINAMFSVMLGVHFSDKQNTTYKTNPQL